MNKKQERAQLKGKLSTNPLYLLAILCLVMLQVPVINEQHRNVFPKRFAALGL